ncbi:uncharacterized protein LOC111447569 isoform X2 [Cucurbita moschata]|uniref:Uncharacterized protein LOC111447569 isoform X2 n=1 Tax=Cucurbita moschata TaxID=3662 RepID=A0A6J1FWJ2_CUCMO|nr:uncharacterized protein LOC111447569 isoform X2 [Cucurbita moschata]
MKMGDEAEINQRRRLPLENFLTLEECRELEFIHKSCCTVGYRPYVFSTTLLHLVVSNSAHLIMPFVSIRERLKEKAEEFFGCEYELFVEFTGLISWTRGARIGWHSDDNRPYLKQREFTAVCYLNSYGVDFEGGLFHFQDGEPKTISPLCGDCVMYTADSLNVHSVDEVVQFLYWKGKELDSTNSKEDSSYAEGLSPKRNVGVDYFKSEFSKDDALAESVFLYASSDVKEKQHRLGWAKLAAVAAAWEDYASNLRRELLRSFAHWRTSQSIYSVPYGS